MFNFSTLITLFFTVIGIYFPTYFIFKKEINDLRLNENEENRQKIIIREKSVKTLNKTVIALILIIMILFSLPYIISLFTTNSSEILGKNIIGVITKILPFGNDCFSNNSFQFSFITGIVLSIIIFIFFMIVTNNINLNIVIKIMLRILLVWGLIWTNYFISSFWVFCIVNYFELISIILNLLIYAIISFLLLILLVLCFGNYMEDSKSNSDFQNIPPLLESNNSSSLKSLETKKELKLDDILESIDSRKSFSHSNDKTE
ncbi:MAG: hypothetical protein HFE79_09480 [Ruminiclostridium sp.]|nr:hypothetical protein [Ruminiclostridium sp.]